MFGGLPLKQMKKLTTMARNEQLKDLQYKAIQLEYEKLNTELKGEKNKHPKILKRLQAKFYLTYRSLEYIVFKEYEKKQPQNINPNQLTIFNAGA